MLTPFGYFLLLIIFVLVGCHFIVFRFYKGIYEIKKQFKDDWIPMITLYHAVRFSDEPAVRFVRNAWWFHGVSPFDKDKEVKCIRRLFEGFARLHFIESDTVTFSRESRQDVGKLLRNVPPSELDYYFDRFDTQLFIEEGVTSDIQMNSMPLHVIESARDQLREIREKNEGWFRIDIVYLRKKRRL